MEVEIAKKHPSFLGGNYMYNIRKSTIKSPVNSEVCNTANCGMHQWPPKFQNLCAKPITFPQHHKFIFLYCQPMRNKDITLGNWRTYFSQVTKQICPKLKKVKIIKKNHIHIYFLYIYISERRGGQRQNNTQTSFEVITSVKCVIMQCGSTLGSH